MRRKGVRAYHLNGRTQLFSDGVLGCMNFGPETWGVQEGISWKGIMLVFSITLSKS